MQKRTVILCTHNHCQVVVREFHENFERIWPNEKIGVVQVTRPSLIFYPSTLNFFSPNFKVEKKYQKKMYQNAHLNEKLSFYAFIL